MSRVRDARPDDDRLRAALEAVLGMDGRFEIERIANPHRGAFASERVDVHVAGRPVLRAFVKYGERGRHVGHGYWGGVEREARVYRELLAGIPLPLPRLLGAHRDDASGETWLVLEHLGGYARLDQVGLATARRALARAVRWLADFHRATEAWADATGAGSVLAELPRYGRAYFEGWRERTEQYVGPLERDHPWLRPTLRTARTRLDVLDTPPRCLVHGELYPGNVLVGELDVRPVDWQSVAVGRGEIDLASLLEGWSRVVSTDDLVASYRRRRWPDGAPRDFFDALAAARLYWPMRWLGDRPRWTLHPTRRGHVRTLRAAAQACGITGAQEGGGA